MAALAGSGGVVSLLSPTAHAAPGVLAEYGFEATSGTVLTDSSGNNLNGTLVNGPVWTASGKNGRGLQFDGVDDYVNLGNPTALQITGSMTLSTWVYETANPGDDGQFLAKANGSVQFKSSPDTGVRTFAIAVTGSTGLVQRYSRTVRQLNTWYHVAGVYNASARTLDIYVNGVLDNGVLDGTIPSVQTNVSSSATLGRRSTAWYLIGRLDDFRIYNRALSAAEISSDMNTAAGGTPPPPPQDSTPPSSVAVTAPANGASVTGTVTVSGTASDNVGVAGVTFLLDGSTIGTEDTTAPYSVSWNTTTASTGNHILTARARDAAGNTATSSNVTVRVDRQAPSGSITINGGASATNSTAATLTLAASDDSGSVAQMRFSNTGSSFSTAEAFNTTKAWTLSTGSGTKTVYVQFADPAGNWSASFTDTITLDTTAPTISSVSSDTITGVSARITWTTNEASTSRVDYGPNTNYGSSTPLDTNRVTSHAVVLNNLSPSTAYQYRVRSIDAAGNERIGTNNTFTTGASSDATPPDAPSGLSATAVSPTQINLSWTAPSDNVGVTGYFVYRNGTQVGTPSTNAFQSTGLQPATTYDFTVRARDAAGNISGLSNTATETTLNDTTPPTAPSSLSGAAGSNSVQLTWIASSDAVGVAQYLVYRDGAQVGTTTTPGFSDGNLTPTTPYEYVVAAVDGAGNRSPDSAPYDITTLAPSVHPVFPLKVSSNGRYLVDQNNKPFMIAGDSPQDLVEGISLAKADMFLANRESYGMNAMWVNLINNFVNGQTYDGIKPFNVEGDLSTPNEAFFARADAMIRLAADHHIVVILDPIETQDLPWLQVLRNNGPTKARNYGRYLGNRYKNFDNIIWMSGADFQTWTNAYDNEVVSAVALGIKDFDTRHLHTVELDVPVSGSRDSALWDSIIELNASYTYNPAYAQVLKDYNRVPAKPTFMVEANYEFENNTGNESGTPYVLRLQEYRSQLSGAAGQLYGSDWIWQFLSGWENNLNTPGAAQFGIMIDFFKDRRWYDLVPDQTHTLVTAGYGTFSDVGTNAGNDYLTAALTADGALGIAYMPTRRTITVNMARFSAPVTVRWFDPVSATYQAVSGSPFANTGTRQFTPPSNNSGGDGDWALVFEVAP